MNERPYTYKQAAIIAESFQFLKGRPYDKAFTGTTPVLAVVVAPYGEVAQEQFMDRYERTGKIDLHRYDPENGFDVVVIARYQHDMEIYLWMDVETFAHNNIQLPQRAEDANASIIPLGKELAA